MVTALNVANSILVKAKESGIGITPMKLQKLLYFLYREFLQVYETALFSERFEAWEYGPVITSVYIAFKRFKSDPISDFYREVDGTVMLVSKRSTEFMEILDRIWKRYGLYSGMDLSRMTHTPGSAWDKAMNDKRLFLSDDDITNERIYQDEYRREEMMV